MIKHDECPRPKEQRPVCYKCQTPMVRYDVPHTGYIEQAWRLACYCKRSAVSEVVPSNRKTVPTFGGRLYTYEHTYEHENGLSGNWVRRAEVDALLDEIEHLRDFARRVGDAARKALGLPEEPTRKPTFFNEREHCVAHNAFRCVTCTAESLRSSVKANG